jgi:predicted Zn-dependent protease
MGTTEAAREGRTPAELLEMPEAVREVVLRVASTALDAGRDEEAERILEGLVALQPREPVAWALLARAHQRNGKALAARFAAAVGGHLAPAEPLVQLSLAEIRMGSSEERERGIQELRQLRSSKGAVGERATAILAALGER